MQTWWIWFIMAAVMAIGELFTAGFFLLWFAVGAAIAGIMDALGLGAGWQWATFVIVSGILVAISRKFAEKVTSKQPPGIGADRFVDEMGVVLEEIDNVKNTGRVRIEKDEWRADSSAGKVIPEGALVRVVKVNGAHLVVKQINKGEKQAENEESEETK